MTLYVARLKWLIGSDYTLEQEEYSCFWVSARCECVCSIYAEAKFGVEGRVFGWRQVNLSLRVFHLVYTICVFVVLCGSVCVCSAYLVK